jgi:DNA-binding protein H-NS
MGLYFFVVKQYAYVISTRVAIRRRCFTEGMKMALKTMPINRLMDLRQKVEATLAAKVAEHRRTLEAQLAKLTRFGAGVSGRGAGRGKVPPKYRNPDNSAETWAGRGLTPLWLTAALKGGKKLEDFSITPTQKKTTAKKTLRRSTKAKR